ncbi:MAG: alpha/beta hydrolase-fold protein [Pirellulales bacterium]
MSRNGLGLGTCIVAACLLAFPWATAQSATLTLKDGRTIKGKIGQLDSLKNKGKQAPGSIVLIDDGLRRYFIPQKMIQEVKEGDAGERQERFIIRQSVPENGRKIAAIGPIAKLGAFDDFGRRRIDLVNATGIINVIQGITTITPTWTEAVSLKDFIWETRLATSSIPRDTLSKVLHTHIDPKNINQRLQIVRLYLQSERSRDAKDELDAVLADFPEEAAQLKPARQSLAQMGARRLLGEADVYASAGRHQLAYSILEHFPSDDVAGEILQEVREKLTEYNGLQTLGQQVVQAIDGHVEQVADAAQKSRLEPIVQEIKSNLNIHTLDRFAAYRQAQGDEKLLAEEKLALAVSGWLLGSNASGRNLSVALSTYDVRDEVVKYMNVETIVEREKILKGLESKEGSDPETLAGLLAHMTPPLATPTPEVPGFYELELSVQGDETPISYLVQLPPEYSPYRSYPAVVTLHGAGTMPQQQVDWWAGSRGEDGLPRGQAARHGYITIAPRWARDHQKEYEFSAREHACVLASLRDACRRFSIDTDHVFLSGHSMGGTAAWDIGLAHPDLWAGVIPVVALSDKFIARYYKNARNLPIYFVCGELDGDKTVVNYAELDRYFRYGFPIIIAEFLGRGHEHFSDEILNLFDWMGRTRRDFYPKEFECVTMRETDHFFWWLEASGLPDKAMVDEWPPTRGTREAVMKGRINENNTLTISAGAKSVIVWLTPELIDFKRRSQVTFNGSKITRESFIQPESSVLLEDVRSRGDRLHPFWAKVESR